MKTNEISYFSNLFDKVLYMFRTVPLSIIRSISTLYCYRPFFSGQIPGYFAPIFVFYLREYLRVGSIILYDILVVIVPLGHPHHRPYDVTTL